MREHEGHNKHIVICHQSFDFFILCCFILCVNLVDNLQMSLKKESLCSGVFSLDLHIKISNNVCGPSPLIGGAKVLH